MGRVTLQSTLPAVLYNCTHRGCNCWELFATCIFSSLGNMLGTSPLFRRLLMSSTKASSLIWVSLKRKTLDLPSPAGSHLNLQVMVKWCLHGCRIWESGVWPAGLHMRLQGIGSTCLQVAESVWSGCRCKAGQLQLAGLHTRVPAYLRPCAESFSDPRATPACHSSLRSRPAGASTIRSC